MKQSDTTARFPQPFAAQADGSIVAYPLPTTKQASGRVSLLNGFPLENFTALSAGGVPPSGADFNGLFRTLTEAIRANEAGQIRAFNADYAQQIGGYPQSALVCDPNTPTRLLLSTQDDNKTDPASDTSGAWVSLTDSISALDAAKVNRTGDTMTGDLVITGNGQYGATIFGGKVTSKVQDHPENSFLQAQIINGKPAAVLGVQDAQQEWHTWYFNAADGRVTTPSGHTVLEGDDIGNGHITLQNSGTATGKTLATTDDVTAETQRAQAAENAKINRAGDVVTDTLLFTYGNSYQSWAGSPQIQYTIGGGFASVWAQVNSNNDMRLILGANNPGQVYQSWQLNPTIGTITTPSGNTVPEISGIGGRVVIQSFIARVSDRSPRGYIAFPQIFAPGTQPFVMCAPVTEHGTETTSITDVKQNSDGTLQITNAGFNYYRTIGTGDSLASYTIPVLAIGTAP